MKKKLTIENTTFCQADCIVCVRDKMNFGLGTMNQELFEKSVEEIYLYHKNHGDELASIEFGGMGEPLIDNEIGRKCKYVKDKYPNIVIGLTTNGGLLKQREQVICEYIDVLKISNYGFEKNSFENIHRGSLVFENVTENIESFLKINKNNRPKVIMSFLCLKENKGEEWKWKEYWEDKCDEIYIWKPHNWAGYKEALSEKKGTMHSCGRPGKDFVIRANGDVSVCCWDFNRELVIGNINNDSFTKIMCDCKLARILDMHRDCSFINSGTICEKCDQIFDRADALIYSSDCNFKVGRTTLLKTELF